MKNQLKLVIVLMIVVIISLFAIINNANVPINFIFTTVELPLIIILVLALLIGGLLSYLLSLTNMIQKNKEISKLKKAVNDAQKDYQIAIEEIAKLEDTLDKLEQEQATNVNNEQQIPNQSME
ncbi:Uncharacterized integral membrane protein [Granulicatella balaenopterae]|uniref:Uncharacterized integral membrane protein n=1 Tax=Granulicatella balaenopterae TaxID=137733 RepID=A0A1H9GS34_9LACT|nr:lipopolysaccharide assembly protein LapA domain-containing protein [Granulicatella balaenopterae]SEQ52892.1 Uncharacterized integral membrane protein [Granulicatella balaenopterae]